MPDNTAMAQALMNSGPTATAPTAPNSGSYSPESIRQRRRMAELLMQQGSSTQPIRHWAQGLAQMAQAGLGGYMMGEAERDERRRNERFGKLVDLIAAGDTGAAPTPSMGTQTVARALMENRAGGEDGNSTTATPIMRVAQAMMQNNPSFAPGGDTGTVPLGSSRAADDGSQYAPAIAGIESGGRYDARGPLLTSGSMAGQRALGKYQVMESNIGPWTKQHFGQELTPQQFVQNPQAQDAVFNGQFGQYAQKYGPEGAAKAWFAGENGMNNPNARDVLGTTVSGYADKFNRANGEPSSMPAATPQRSQIPPAHLAAIKEMMQDPETRGAGMALLAKYSGPAQYGFQTLPDGTILRTDPRSGSVSPIYQAPSKPTWGVVGEDASGNKQYGWIDTFKKSVDPYTVPGGGQPSTVTLADGRTIAVPPGQDPKKFREHVTTATADALAGKLTEVQANATQFANRMEDAERNVRKYAGAAHGMSGAIGGAARSVTAGQYNPIPRGATNWAVPKEYEQFEQAKSQFITALLRKESGAAIGQSEFERYDHEFFPQLGDSAEVIAQKAQARTVAINAMKKGAGPVYQSPSMGVQPQTASAAHDPLGIR